MWSLFVLGLSLMSSDAKLSHVDGTWMLSIEHNSGAMDDAAREAEALARWRSATGPWFERARSEMTAAMDLLAKESSWRLLTLTDAKQRASLPRIYEERVDASAASSHEKKGNRAAVYVMRFHPTRVSGVVAMDIVLQRLPPRATRESFAKKLSEILAKIPQDDLVP